jgi:hypothetical protein
MSIDSILQQIDHEIARLTQARALLNGIGKASPAPTAPAAKAVPVKKAKKKRRKLSEEARKSIADAQRKRWAALRAKAKAK